MPRVVHFEIYTDHPESVQPFYQTVFGWTFQKFEGGPLEYWLVTTGADEEQGINGGMARPREGQTPGTLNTVAVESLDKTIKEIEQQGGSICVPKMTIPKVGWLAYAQDPSGQCLRDFSNPMKGRRVSRGLTVISYGLLVNRSKARD